MLTLSVVVTLFTIVRAILAQTGFDIWWNLIGMVLVEAVFIFISLRPNTTSEQMVFTFRAKKFEWKKKKKLRDVGNYQIVINGTGDLWFSLLSICGIMMDLTNKHFWETMSTIMICMIVVVIPVIIWLSITMYRTGGYEQ